MARRYLTILASLLTIFLSTSSAYAAASTPTTKGLLVAPATSFISMNAGTTKSSNLFVANDSTKAINVAIEVEKFNVNNYSYTYTFNSTNDNWITFSQDQLNLSPGASKDLPYTINVPNGAKPGGYYLSLIASSVLGSGSIKGTAQVASLLYLTVNGQVSHNSILEGYGLHRIFFGKQINYKFDVLDTGNVYSFISESASIYGLSTTNSTPEAAHLIMPGKIRTISGSLKSPKWPGVYKITYGYTTTGGASHQETKLILYVPPWSIALLLALALVLNIQLGKRKRSKANSKNSKDSKN